MIKKIDLRNFLLTSVLVCISSKIDFDLYVRKCCVCNYNLLLVKWFVSVFSSNYSVFGCNKYLNLTQYWHIQSAHFVRYHYVKGEFAIDEENSVKRG